MVSLAAQTIMCGQQNIVIAGGFESMSNIPYYVPKAREGYRYGHGEMLDGLLKDGLWDAYDGHHMGMCAENCADKHGFSERSRTSMLSSLTNVPQRQTRPESSRMRSWVST